MSSSAITERGAASLQNNRNVRVSRVDKVGALPIISLDSPLNGEGPCGS